MKHIYLTFLFSLFAALSFSQYVSPFTVKPELDTIAFRLKIESKTIHEVYDYRRSGDTAKQIQIFYNQKGYPIAEKIIEYRNRGDHIFTIEEGISYEYNKEGYLISEKTYGEGGPIGTSGNDSIFIQTSQRYVLINDKKILLEERTITEYVNDGIFESCDKFIYDSLGVITRIENSSIDRSNGLEFYSIKHFEYYPNGLLKSEWKEDEGLRIRTTTYITRISIENSYY